MLASLARLLAAALAALALGLGSAHVLLTSSSGQANGPWRVWLAGARPLASPYTNAHYFRVGSLPPDSRQRLEFTASTDGSGQGLNARCTYIISASMPAARWWSLEVEGKPEGAISSGKAVLDENGGLTVRAAALAVPGNWLKLPRSGAFALTLRFYGPQGELRRTPLEASLPVISREDCP